MGKKEFERGQYILYTQDIQNAQILLSKRLSEVYGMRDTMADLLVEFSPAWQNFRDNTAEQRLHIHFHDEHSLLFDEDATSKGKVKQRSVEKGEFFYSLAYRYTDINGHDARFRLARELGHLMLNPKDVSRQPLDKETQSRQISGLIRVPCGQENNPKARYGEQLQESAINLIAQLAIRGENSADDIISGKVDLSENNPYKNTDNLVRLLIASMRNDFDKEITFEQLAERKLDSVIKRKDGTKEPANIFLYGILNDSSIIEKEFDKYMGEGAWRELNGLIKQLYKPNINETKFNNIYEEAQNMIVDFASARLKDKYRDKQSEDRDPNAPELSKKTQIINQIIMISKIDRQPKKEFVLGKLSLKQKIVQFLSKSDFLMDIPFVEKLVKKQIMILPEGNQEKTTSNNRIREEFKNWLSNDGEFKNLPNSQTMYNINSNIQAKPKLSGR